MREVNCGFSNSPTGVSGAILLVSYGPTLDVDIGFDLNFDPIDGKNPLSGIKGIKALVDTGAEESCIDSMLAAQLRLPIVDKRPICGVHGSQEVNMHLAQVQVPALDHVVYGVFAGVNLVASGQMHRAIVGRTFLQLCTMVYDGLTGKVIISK